MSDPDRVTWPPDTFPWAVRYDPGPSPDPVLFCRTLDEALFWMGELGDLDPVLVDRLLEGGQ